MKDKIRIKKHILLFSYVLLFLFAFPVYAEFIVAAPKRILVAMRAGETHGVAKTATVYPKKIHPITPTPVVKKRVAHSRFISQSQAIALKKRAPNYLVRIGYDISLGKPLSLKDIKQDVFYYVNVTDKIIAVAPTKESAQALALPQAEVYFVNKNNALKVNQAQHYRVRIGYDVSFGNYMSLFEVGPDAFYYVNPTTHIIAVAKLKPAAVALSYEEPEVFFVAKKIALKLQPHYRVRIGYDISLGQKTSLKRIQSKVFYYVNPYTAIMGVATSEKAAVALSQKSPEVFFVIKNETLSNTLARLADEANYELAWQSKHDYNILFAHTFYGKLLGKGGVLEQILATFRDADYPLRAEITKNNIILIKDDEFTPSIVTTE